MPRWSLGDHGPLQRSMHPRPHHAGRRRGTAPSLLSTPSTLPTEAGTTDMHRQRRWRKEVKDQGEEKRGGEKGRRSDEGTTSCTSMTRRPHVQATWSHGHARQDDTVPSASLAHLASAAVSVNFVQRPKPLSSTSYPPRRCLYWEGDPPSRRPASPHGGKKKRKDQAACLSMLHRSPHS